MLLLELTDEDALRLHKEKERKQWELKKANPKPFDKGTTDMPMYDQMLKDPQWAKDSQGFVFDIVQMRPMDYIRKCADGFGSSINNIEQQRTETGKVDEYVELLANGTTFPMPILVYADSGHFQQEGLHRAFAAHKIGYSRIPVMVIKELP